MQSIAYIPGSDESGNASLMTIQNVRSSGATTILVNTVAGAPAKFFASMGTPHTFTDPVTDETITVISEATAVDFAGHIDGGNVEIDAIAPGFTDNGSEVGDIIVIRPLTEWANNIHNVLAEGHNDDGSHRGGILDNVKTYKYESPDIFINEVDQNNGANTIAWNKPANLKFVIVHVVGAGGAGGATNTTTSTQNSIGEGGGGGGYAQKKILAANLGASETITVAPSVAAPAVGQAGANGTASSFGAHVSAGGGAGGETSGAASTNLSGEGGLGGIGVGGDINVRGQRGGSYRAINGSTIASVSDGGNSPLYGQGGRGNVAGIGFPGDFPGGGGGGSSNVASSAARIGSISGGGVVIVEEYFE